MLKKILFSTIIVAIIMNCEKDPTAVDQETKIKLNGAFILNEGGFGHNNGSLSFYSAEDNQVQNGIFNQINGRNLGDVVQSMTIIDTLGFIVVNNSNKIEVISINSWKSVRTIDMPAGSSPRYLADGGNGKAYVTNLYTNNVSVIDLSTYEIETSINVGANPEGITILDDKAYVAISGFGYGNTISVIDLLSNQVAYTIRVGDNPGSIKIDENEILHILCTGRWGDWNNPDDPGTNGGVYSLDPSSALVTDSLIFTGHPSKLCLDGDEKGFFINGLNVVCFSTNSYEIVSDTLITKNYNDGLYGLDIDPVTAQLFVMEAKDYTQNGSLSIYDLEGTLLYSYNVGIIPSKAVFVYERD